MILFKINIKTKLIITLTISYQFEALIQRIDTEFYCGSRGMVFDYFHKKHIKKKVIIQM